MSKTKIIMPTEKEDAAINAGIAADPDARELSDEEFAQMRPATEVVPELVEAHKSGKLSVRGSQRSPTKVPVYIRLSPEVVEYFKAQGRGWQTRLDAALKEYIASRK
jgi:uncharacterized protein (DUF4415 family)